MIRDEILTKLSFEKLGRPIILKMVPNEDGLGPSTALLYLGEGLAIAAKEYGIRLKIIIQTGTQIKFNEARYENLKQRYPEIITEISLIKRHNIIELAKMNEQVLALETAEKLLDYLWLADEYNDCEKTAKEKIDAYICMITPVVHRTPYEVGIPVIEIADHSWSLSLAKIFEDDKREHRDDWRRKKVIDVIGAEERFRDRKWNERWRTKLVDEVIQGEILPKITEDDTKVHKVFMFPEPLGPGEFYCKWCSLVPGNVRVMNGVFGGVDDKKDREKVRAEVKEKLSAIWFGGNSEHLYNKRLLLIQGGGTPTWDRTLARMLAQCLLSTGLKDRIFLFPKRAVIRLFDSEKCDPQIVKDWGWNSFADVETKVQQSETARLISEEFDRFQDFYIVSDFSFSRPGGITINDNIACRTPAACAAEPGHWQTEKIRYHCELHNVLRSVDFAAFQAGGIGIVLDQYEGQKKANERIVEIMKTIPNHQEGEVAKEILAIIAENRR